MIIAIATLIVALLPADVKLQNAKLERTHTSDESTSRWFVRPYVPVYRDGKLVQVKQRIYLGQVSLVSEREAQRARRVVLDKINRRQIEPQARQLFGDFLDSYIEGHVSKLAVSTQRKYACHINKSEGLSELCPFCAGPILAQCETLTCGWGSVNFFSCDDQCWGRSPPT